MLFLKPDLQPSIGCIIALLLIEIRNEIGNTQSSTLHPPSNVADAAE